MLKISEINGNVILWCRSPKPGFSSYNLTNVTALVIDSGWQGMMSRYNSGRNPPIKQSKRAFGDKSLTLLASAIKVL